MSASASAPSVIRHAERKAKAVAVVAHEAERRSSSKEAAKEAAKPRKEFLNVTADLRRRIIKKVGKEVKDMVLMDPDMWPSVKGLWSSWLDNLYHDIESEIERNLQLVLLYQRECSMAEGPQPAHGFLQPWYRFRAYVLHHYLPHNRSIFGKMNDPVYMVMWAITAIPIHGLRVAFFSVILFMIVVPSPPDEYQTVNFILLFKGMQFLTSGLMMLIMGAMEYYVCYSFAKDTMPQCVDRWGPGSLSVTGQSIDYLGSCILVWLAFALLSVSEQPKSPLHELKEETEAETGQADREAGGRLKGLLYYDLKCFSASLLTLFVITLVTCWEYFWSDEHEASLSQMPQFRANVFWCCVLYAALMLPFFVFMVPGLQTLLIHCDATGYNAQGACVMWEYDQDRAQNEGVEHAKVVADEAEINKYLTWASSAIRTLERGALKRGGHMSFNHLPGDFMRGIGLMPAKKPEPEVAEVKEEVAGHDSTNHVQDMLRKGREARGDPNGKYHFGDFTRGVIASWKQDPGEKASVDEDGLPITYSNGDDSTGLIRPPPCRVAEIVMDPNMIEQSKDMKFSKRVVHYDIEVIPEPLTQDELAGVELGDARRTAPWHIKRRYGDFYRLYASLPQLPTYSDALFPPKIGLYGSWESKVLTRRMQLEAWLNKIVREEASRPSWSMLLRDFLSEDRASSGEDEEASFSSSKALALPAYQRAPGSAPSSFVYGPPKEPLEDLDDWLGRRSSHDSEEVDRTVAAGAGVAPGKSAPAMLAGGRRSGAGSRAHPGSAPGSLMGDAHRHGHDVTALEEGMASTEGTGSTGMQQLNRRPRQATAGSAASDSASASAEQQEASQQSQGAFQQLLQRGKEARGADASSDYQFGDFTRGVFSGGKPRQDDKP